MGYTALLSGGKDSICTASVLCKRGELDGCVFVDTGIAAPDTRPFVERLCKEKGWPLLITHPKRTYEEIVLQYGFPKNLVGHSWAFGILKEYAMRAARDELGKSTVFASGARAAESARRAKNVARGFRHNGHLRIINPIEDWSTPRVWSYLRTEGLPVSPAYLSVGRSGDCFCGAFSQRGEQRIIARVYPDMAKRIRALERKVDTEAHPFPENRWGSKRSKGGFGILDGQMTLERIICGGDCAGSF